MASNRTYYILAIVGIILFIGSAVMYFVFPEVVSKKVQEVRRVKKCVDRGGDGKGKKWIWFSIHPPSPGERPFSVPTFLLQSLSSLLLALSTFTHSLAATLREMRINGSSSYTHLSIFPSLSVEKTQKLPLRNDSESTKKWMKVSVPIYFRIYVWDIKNSESFQKDGLPPLLVERGPYTFREVRTKERVSFSEDQTNVTYHDIKTFYFEPELSMGSLEDEVNVINVPLVVSTRLAPHSKTVDPLKLKRFLKPILSSPRPHTGNYWKTLRPKRENSSDRRNICRDD